MIRGLSEDFPRNRTDAWIVVTRTTVKRPGSHRTCALLPLPRVPRAQELRRDCARNGRPRMRRDAPRRTTLRAARRLVHDGHRRHRRRPDAGEPPAERFDVSDSSGTRLPEHGMQLRCRPAPPLPPRLRLHDGRQRALPPCPSRELQCGMFLRRVHERFGLRASALPLPRVGHGRHGKRVPRGKQLPGRLRLRGGRLLLAERRGDELLHCILLPHGKRSVQ
jgi:hypothetical protein